MFLSVFVYGNQVSHKVTKKVNFVKKEGLRIKHNDLVNPERILPFVDNKYNSIILKGGQVFSKLKVSESHMNIKDKKNKNYVFDVHSSKNVGCAKCHISEPNKTAKATNYIGRLNILIDKGSIDGYLGKQHGNVANFKVKTCIECHKDDVAKHASWLPATSNHMEKISCETCHINKREMFTAKSFNYALVRNNNEPFITYLGKKGKSIVGFTPNTIWYKGKTDKNIKIKPANMVSFLVWKDGKNFVDAKILKKAFYVNGKLNSEIAKSFDGNKDGKLSVLEANFDNKTKKEVAIKLLKQAGVKEPKLKLISFPVALEHNVMPKEMATRSCESCHSNKAKSELYKDSEILGYVATEDIDIIIPGVKDTKLAKIVDGKIILDKDKLPKEHFMMITDTSNKEYDQYAIILLIATLLGLLGHGMLRIMFASKRNSKG
jgi:nitrate/TMAO reductase-like tetraheme cytochrome c subunit